MGDQRTVTEWKIHVNRDGRIQTFKCKNCKMIDGHLQYRNVTERDGENYREWKVECAVCGHNTGIFRTRLLAEKTWEGENDEYWNQQKAAPVSAFAKAAMRQ